MFSQSNIPLPSIGVPDTAARRDSTSALESANVDLTVELLALSRRSETSSQMRKPSRMRTMLTGNPAASLMTR